MNINKAIVCGRVVNDIEERRTKSGLTTVNFGIATNRKRKKNDGTIEEETEFHNITAYGKLAEIIAQYISKGQIIYIEGRLRTKKWEWEGKTFIRTEIIAEKMQMGPKSRKETEEIEKRKREEKEIEEITKEDFPF